MNDDAEILARLYNACNPNVPAKAEYYVDASAVRGGNALTRQFLGELSKTDTHLTFLFSGHIGCGKSSELEDLRRTLNQAVPLATPLTRRYFPILLDANDYLDDYDVTSTDILLAIVAEVAATLKDDAGIELQDSYFRRRLDEVKGFFLSEVEINEGELPLWGAKAKVQRLKKDPTAREKVRERLLPQTTTILTEINSVFDEARLRLKQLKLPKNEPPYTDIVLIMDNLEKIQRFDGKKNVEESHRELFLERAPQLTGLTVHLVYTVPLSLVLSHGPQLERTYGYPPFVLPMIKVAERDGTAYEAGRDCLRTLIAKRTSPTRPDAVFEQEALEFLLTYCGGHVRDLMGFIRRACGELTSLPITLKAAHRAISGTIRMFEGSIHSACWPKLAALERSPDQKIDNNDSDYRRMLEMVAVMEYINGGDESDPFTPSAPWYAVNPIVRHLSRFKSAVEAIDRAKDQP